MRYTAADVTEAFQGMVKAAKAAGINTDDVALISGSPTYGRMFRVVRVHPINGGHYTWDAITEHIGSTRAEAIAILRAVSRSFWAVSDGRESTPPASPFRTPEPWPSLSDPRRRF